MRNKKENYWYNKLHIISWVVFIGLCIEACAFIFNGIATMFFSASADNRFWNEVNLNEVYQYNQSSYLGVISVMIIVAVLRAVLFYRIIQLFHYKQLDFAQPFTQPLIRGIRAIAFLSVAIGIVSVLGVDYVQFISERGVVMPPIQHLRIAGGDVWIFMGIVLLVIEQMFKKGMALQSDNDLTI